MIFDGLAVDALPDGVCGLIAVLLGLCLGSFATAMAHRIPEGLSLVTKKRSGCPSCGHNLALADLVPLFSYLYLRGKCRYCKAPIGWRYPAIEIATVSMCFFFYVRFGVSVETVTLFMIAPVLVAMADIDFRFKIIPDGLNLSSAIIAFLGLFLQMLLSPSPAVMLPAYGTDMAGGVLLYGLGALALRQLFLMVTKRDALGFGDVKFFAVTGLWLGTDIERLAVFLIAAGFSGVVLGALWKNTTGDKVFPFGPALGLALVAVLLWRGACFFDI